MAATTAPAVKAYLVSIFTTATAAEETQVWFNRPNMQHEFDENVYVGGVRGERDFASLGRPHFNQMEETYSIEVEVEVYRDGTDAEGTENRLWEICAQLEGALEDPTLGGQQGIQRAYVRRLDQSSKGGTNGWLAAVALSVEVVARI